MRRRNFLKSFLGAFAIRSVAQGAPKKESPPRAKVVDVSCPSWERDGRPDPEKIGEMIDRGLCRLLDRKDPASCWRELFSPRERVAIKFNRVSRNFSGANQALVDAISERLLGVGLKRENLFVVEAVGAKFTGGGKPDLELGRWIALRDRGARFTRFLTEQIDAILNVPDLKDHDRGGITGALKNVSHARQTFIDNPARLHLPGLEPYLSEICRLPFVRKKRRLVITNGLKAIFELGPLPVSPLWQWRRDTLLLALDSVAADRVQLQIVEEKRRQMAKQNPRWRRRLVSLWKCPWRPPVHIGACAEKGLGEGDLKKIEWVKLKLE